MMSFFSDTARNSDGKYSCIGNCSGKYRDRRVLGTLYAMRVVISLGFLLVLRLDASNALFSRQGSPEGGHPMLMKKTAAVRVLI